MNTALVENGIVTYVWNNGTFDGKKTKNHVETDECVEPNMTYSNGVFNYPKPTNADKEEAELQTKRDEFSRVKQCYLENPNDISRPERIEFSEYFTFADNDLFYPIEEYPLIVAQIQEWTLNGKL